MLVIFIVIAIHGGFFQSAIHLFDLAVCPRMVDLGKAVFDLMLMAHVIKDVKECPPIIFAVGELDAVIGEDGMDAVRHDCDEIAQELRSFHLAMRFEQLDIGIL